MKPGIYPNISNHDYHNGVGISNSGLTQLARSPLHYWSAYLDPNRKPKTDTPATLLGTAIHTSILEPERFKQEYVVQPSPEDYPQALVDASDFKTACKKYGCKVTGTKPELRHSLESVGADVEFFDDIAEKITRGKKVLSADDYETCLSISQNIRTNPAAKSLFSANALVENTLFWVDPDTGVLCRCRPDWWARDDGDFVVDIKSTTDASPDGFQRSVVSFRYWVQAAFYFDGIKSVTGRELNDFIFAAWEKKPPYACAFYYATPELIHAGREEYKRLLKIYSECQMRNQWPGYGDMMKPLCLPAWFGKRTIDAEPEFDNIWE